MSLIYSDNNAPFTGSINFARIDAVKQYLKHYENYLALDFFLRNGTTAEKHQASKEMTICERKMKFWQRQDNYSQSRALDGVQRLKRMWAS